MWETRVNIIIKLLKNITDYVYILLSKRFFIICFPYVLLILSVLAFNVSYNRVNHRYSIKTFFKQNFFVTNIESQNQDDFIGKNVYFPDISSIDFSCKKNIVLILAESLESSFSKYSLTPNLDRLSLSAISNKNFDCAYGTGWTIAAITAWNFGLPLKLPDFIKGNSYGKMSFLPNATSIFEILRYNGYTTDLLMGTDSSFSNQHILFESHGEFQIRDYKYWLKKYPLSKDNQGCWGYSDKFVLSRLKEEYLKLKENYKVTKKNFILFGQTIDTHGPDGGFCPKHLRHYHDIRDAIVYFDSNIGEFIDWFNKNSNDDDILVVIGDHLMMGDWDFLNDMQRYERKIFNGIWSKEKLTHIDMTTFDPNKHVLTYDIAPTLLELAGAKLENRRYGLGESIFSSNTSEIEKFSEKELENKLSKKSLFYEELY